MAIEAGISIVAGAVVGFFTFGGGAAVGGAIAATRIASAARKILGALRALKAAAKASAVAKLTSVVSKVKPLRAVLAKFKNAKKIDDAADAAGPTKLPWTSWQNYPKVTVNGREYAQIGDRLYTKHAVDRLQPSGLGAPLGAVGAGRSVSPTFIDDILRHTKGVDDNGPEWRGSIVATSAGPSR